MIYLDAAATSLQKPDEVYAAVDHAIRNMASPGRGGHQPAMLAADLAFDCRCDAAELFHMDAPEDVVFTFNATHGLNIAINSLVRPGDKVVTSGYEHNSVMRPLRLCGAETAVAASPLWDSNAMAAAFAAALPGAKAAVCTMMSNVFGFITPIEDIAELCRKNGVPLIIDASQAAGNTYIDFKALDAAFIAMPGHKGLMGPQGTGLLLCGQRGRPLLAGGTGSDSKNPDMPEDLPDRLEAGTHNITGIAGLREGIRYVKEHGAAQIGRHESTLLHRLGEGLRNIPELEVFLSDDPQVQGGVLSVRHPRIDCEFIAESLGAAGVAVRAGQHCAPWAHKMAGTEHTGTVRFSVSPFNTVQEMDQAAEITADCVKKLLADRK